MRKTKMTNEQLISESLSISTSVQQGSTIDKDGNTSCDYAVVAGAPADPGPQSYEDAYVAFYIPSTATVSAIYLSYFLRGTCDGDDTKIATCNTYVNDGSTFTDRTAAIETALGTTLAITGCQKAINVTAYFTGTGWKGIKLSYAGAANVSQQVYYEATR